MPESTSPPLARAALDRDGEARGVDGFAERFDADPASRVIVLHRGRALLAERVDGSAPRLQFLEPARAPGSTLRCYLGRTVAATAPVASAGEAAADVSTAARGDLPPGTPIAPALPPYLGRITFTILDRGGLGA